MGGGEFSALLVILNCWFRIQTCAQMLMSGTGQCATLGQHWLLYRSAVCSTDVLNSTFDVIKQIYGGVRQPQFGFQILVCFPVLPLILTIRQSDTATMTGPLAVSKGVSVRWSASQPDSQCQTVSESVSPTQ